MKKIIIASLLSCLTSLSYAQFSLTKDGLINSTDSSMNYIVFSFNGMSQSDLYKSTLIYFHSVFVSPKDVISAIENETININAISKNDIYFANILGSKVKLTMNYSLMIRFKDGKIRIDIPVINSIINEQSQKIEHLYLYKPFCINIFSKNGEVKNEVAKISIEKFFNDFAKNMEKNRNMPTDSNW